MRPTSALGDVRHGAHFIPDRDQARRQVAGHSSSALCPIAASCIVIVHNNKRLEEMGGALSGKTILVTGASAGIGKAAAIALAEAGAKIIATGRRKLELDALVRQCGGAVTEAIAGDLNDAHFVADLAKRAHGVDILVNNAGILKYAPLMDMTDGDVEAMFRT